MSTHLDRDHVVEISLDNMHVVVLEYLESLGEEGRVLRTSHDSEDLTVLVRRLFRAMSMTWSDNQNEIENSRIDGRTPAVKEVRVRCDPKMKGTMITPIPREAPKIA